MSKQLSRSPLVHTPVQISNVHLGPYTEVGEMSFLENVEMGAYSYCGPFCFFQNARIGKFSNIAASVRIGPTRHPIERPTLHHFTYRRKMYGFDDRDDEEFFAWRARQLAYVGHDTWIGHGAIIMPNVAVGDGSIVGAGAVVTHDVPRYSVVAGVPARVVRQRFTADIVAAMERIRWWDWTHDEIGERLEAFCGSTEEFVTAFDPGPDAELPAEPAPRGSRRAARTGDRSRAPR